MNYKEKCYKSLQESKEKLEKLLQEQKKCFCEERYRKINQLRLKINQINNRGVINPAIQADERTPIK